MKPDHHPTPVVAALLAFALAALLAGLAPTSAHAAVTPPYEPDPNSTGALVFYNAAGAVVTGGSINDQPFATYVQAQAAGRSGDSKATLFGYLPKNGIPTGAFSGEAMTASTSYPDSSAPASLASSPLPLVKVTAADETIATLIDDLPNTATDGYQGLYQLRVKTSGVGQVAGATYDAADIFVSGTTWTQVYPAVSSATPTTTALQVSPSSPVLVGTSVTLTATVSPAQAAGSVQFFDGPTALGAAVTVSSGSAQVSTSALTAGNHSLTATFTSSDSSTFASSASSASSMTVTTPGANQTTTALDVSPASPVAQGTAVDLTATVTPSDATGTIQFSDGTTAIGDPVDVSGGTAHASTSGLAAGTHSLTAAFAPADSNAFGASTSQATSFVVQGQPGAASVTLADQSGKPIDAGSTLTPGATFTVTGSGFAAGETVTITVQSTPVTLASVTADSSGNITSAIVLPADLEAGQHTLTVAGQDASATFAFTVADPADGTSTSTSSSSSADGGGDSGVSGTETSTVTDPLARTGTDVESPLRFGAALVFAGLGMITLAVDNRRRFRGRHEH